MSHNNIDDGWDLFTKTDTGPIGPVTIEDSLSYNNGTLSNGGQAGNGDRNGFKLGGEDIAVNHIVRRSIAFHNGKHGFTYNRNLGTMTISNNLSIDNDSGNRNFNFDGGTSVFRNNTSCRFNGSGTNDRIIGNSDSSNQFWIRHQRLPVRQLLRRPGLVLRLRRPPRRDPRRQGGHAVASSTPARVSGSKSSTRTPGATSPVLPDQALADEIELLPQADRRPVRDQRRTARVLRRDVAAVDQRLQAEGAVRVPHQEELLPQPDGGAVGDQRRTARVLGAHEPLGHHPSEAHVPVGLVVEREQVLPPKVDA